MPQNPAIRIQGTRTHNLQNISLDIPRNMLVVFTGPSGAGKTSLAVDTLYAEAQRRFADSLSSYARRFLDLMDKPDLDYIGGLSPAICIDNRKVTGSRRSTLGTAAEIYGFLRLLYAQAGHVRSTATGIRLSRHSPQEIADEVAALAGKNNPERLKIILLSPVLRKYQGDLSAPLDEYLKQGYARVRLNGRILRLDGRRQDPAGKTSDLDIVIDRLVLERNPSEPGKEMKRLTSSIELALKTSGGELIVHLPDENRDIFFSDRYADPHSGESFSVPGPTGFSFNSPEGACPKCEGLGFGPDENTCEICGGGRLKRSSLGVTIRGLNIGDVSALSVSAARTWCRELMEGAPAGSFPAAVSSAVFKHALPAAGEDDLSVRELGIGRPLLAEIESRLHLLEQVGLSYLRLDRVMHTLSWGEAQRVYLASQIGGGLSGIMYILDEPSAGLHMEDQPPLLALLEKLAANGNSVICVEHSPEFIKRAGHVVEFGPGAGPDGGRIVFSGTPGQLLKADTISGQTLSGRMASFQKPGRTDPGSGPGKPAGSSRSGPGKAPAKNKPARFIELAGIHCRNIQSADVRFPLQALSVITGVSGSGKTTLLRDILLPCLSPSGLKAADTRAADKVAGREFFDQLIYVDQSPIGRSPRSNPATFTGIFSAIRGLFAAATEARIRGYKAGRFSFNNAEGQCRICRGDGQIKIDMQFLSDAAIPCESCGGTGYNRDTLQIRFKGINIHEVLQMTASEALVFFRAFPGIVSRLQAMADIGLGYIRLGQPGPTLSGGEAQRLKLAAALAGGSSGRALYLLDEPSAGLHFQDVQVLLAALSGLVGRGNTVIAADHNLTVIRSADWVVDLGPGGGEQGGKVVAMGTVETVRQSKGSATGKWLQKADTAD